MAFDVAAAKQAGYSDAEIAEYLGQQKGFDAAAAMSAGYSPAEIIGHLGGGAPTKKSTVSSELKRGAQQLASGVQTAYGALTGSPEEAARAGVERGQAISQVAGEGVGFEPVKKAYQEKGLLSAAGEAIGQIPRALAGQGANLAAMAGGARLGAMAGSAVAPGVGTLVGGALGAGAAMLPQFFGSNVERQAAEQMEKGEPIKIDRTKAGIAAAGQAALEGAGSAFTLGKGVVKGILGVADDAALTTAKAAQQLEATARRSLTGTVARGAGRGVVSEMPVEVAQQVIERVQAGLELTSPEALQEYGEAAYQAGLVGGPLGGAGNVVSRGQAQSRLAQREADAKAKAQADAAAAEEARANAEPTLPLVTAPGVQGEMFTAGEMGTPPAAEPTAKAPPAALPAEPAGEQDDLGLDYQREYADMAKERERLKQQPQTPEVQARLEELGQQMALYTQSDIESMRAQKEAETKQAKADAEATKRFPALANAPDLLTQSDEVKARTQGELFPGEDLGTAPVAEPIAEPTLRPKKEAGPVQAPLGLRRNPEGQPTAFGQPEPTITSADIMLTAVPVPKGVEGWLLKNVVGGTRTQLESLIAKDPTLVQGSTSRAKILRSLTAKDVPAFEEAKRVEPTPTPTPAVEQRDEPRAGEPSVGVSGEPAVAGPNEPAAGVPAAPAEPVTPDGRGLVPAGRDAVPGDGAQGAQPAAVTSETEPAKSLQEKLQGIIDDKNASKRSKQTAFAALDSLTDPDMNETAEDRQQNEAYAEKALQTAEQQRRYSTAKLAAKGQSLASLQQEIASAKGPLAEALRRMVRSGKVKLEAAHPDGNKGGLFDGKTVTLYAQGIPEGEAMGVALHEVGAHMGLAKLLGQNQYDALINTLLDWIELSDNSPQAKLAQLAYRRIPIKNLKDPDPTEARDEMVAYFVEELARAEAAGKLPKQGPLRVMWNKIKTAILTSLNKALGRSFGISSLTPQQVGMLAEAAMTRESYTGIDEGATPKQQFSVAPATRTLIDSMGDLETAEKPLLARLIDGFKAQSEPGYAVKFRTQVADSAATIEHRLRERFDGAVRDSLGRFNPMGLYRQAQDHAKLLLEYFQQGSLVKDPVTGLWKVGTVRGVRPPAEVYALIDKYAAKNGQTREEATKDASRILEGVRLDAMRTSNKSGATDFQLHLKDPEIDMLVREYNADPDLQAMSKLMDEARIAMVNNLVAVGRLTAEQGKEWADVVGYVPFDRIEDFAENYSKVKKISNKGIAQLGKLPELIGSETRMVGNVFDNYLNTLGWMVGQTMKTDATLQTLRALERVQTGPQAVYLGRSDQKKPNAVYAYVNGEKMFWEVPSKYDVLAFKDLNPPKAGWLRAMGQFSNVLRKAVTALPPFALKQVTDDVQRAILTSGVKHPGALLRMALTNFPKLAYAELKGIQHPDVRAFGALGLTGEYDFEAGKPATSLLKDLGYKKRGKFETLLHRLDGITRASDLAVRKAIYDQTMKESNNDQLLAQTRAREFINFRRRGANDFVGAMVTTIPFFNAYIQGMDVLYRAASGKDSSSSVDRAQARRLFWSRASTVMMLSSLYALGKDDEDEEYKEMDLRTRDGNWILPGGYKIPVPGELGALFKVIPERVVEYMKRSGTPEEQDAWEATRTALSYIYEQYVGRAAPVPQVVKPLLEAWANKSFLTGRALEGFHHQQLEPSMRRTDQTSELAQAIANFSRDTIGVQVSPIMVDNTLRGYFGSTAALLTATTDSLLNPTRVDRPLHKWALLSTYMYDPVGTRRMTEFYEERDVVSKAGSTLRELMKTDMDKAEAYANEHADELQLESAINSTLQQLENTRAYRKHINSPDGAKEMSVEEREETLKEIKQMELDFVKWLREAKGAIRQDTRQTRTP